MHTYRQCVSGDPSPPRVHATKYKWILAELGQLHESEGAASVVIFTHDEAVGSTLYTVYFTRVYNVVISTHDEAVHLCTL